MTAIHKAVLRGLAALLLIAAFFAATGAPASAQGYAEGFGAYEAGDFQRAYDIWLGLAEHGDRDAQYSLGKLLETGGGAVARNYEQAAGWYERSAAQGVAHAQNNLGLMLAQGRGVPRDPQRAAELWRAAAEQGHAIAQFNLALAYFRGEGVSEDKSKAETWFRSAAELGLPEAQYALGQVRRLGLTGPADENEALNWYQLAAAQGHEKAASEAATLRAKGVTPKAVAPMVPSTAPEPAMAETPGETVPVPALVEAPAETPPQVAEAPAVAATEGPIEAPVEAVSPAGSMAAGGYRLWLRSERDADAADVALADAQARHPEIFAQASGAVIAVNLGEGGVFHRIVAGGLSSDVAAALCRGLREAEPGAFCKVQASN